MEIANDDWSVELGQTCEAARNGKINKEAPDALQTLQSYKKWKVDDYMTERNKEIAKLFITEQPTYRELGER